MIVCSCSRVDSKQLQAAFDAGNKTYLTITSATKTARGCGSCTPRIMDELGRMKVQAKSEGTLNE